MTSWPESASGSVRACTSVHSTKRSTSEIARFEAVEIASSLNACTGPALVEADGASFFFLAPSSTALAGDALGSLPTAAGASG